MNITQKELAITLIQQDLKHSQFILSLDRLGLSASDHHHLYLLDVVNDLMEVPDGNLSIQWGSMYTKLVADGVFLGTVSSMESFRSLAENCYNHLVGLLEMSRGK